MTRPALTTPAEQQGVGESVWRSPVFRVAQELGPATCLLDEHLAARGEEVDRENFEEMAGPHYAGLVRRLTLILHNHEEAKDVAQDAYWRAYRAWDRFHEGDVRAWLHRIGTRLAINELRHRRVRNRVQHKAPANTWQPAEELDLWMALDRLRKEHRAALMLNVLDGYTQLEIASMLSVPPGTVASWIATAKRELRIAISGENQ